MGLFRRLRDRFLTDIEVAFPRPADADAWSFEVHDFFRDRIAAAGDETAIKYVFLGGFTRLPAWLRIVAPDGSAVTIERKRLGLVEMRGRMRRLRLPISAFYLEVGETYQCKSQNGLDLTFRRIRRRDRPRLQSTAA